MSERSVRFAKCPIELPDDEVSDTTGDDSSTEAGAVIVLMNVE